VADTFTNWYDGAPVLQSDDTHHFNAWFDGAPVLQFAGTAISADFAMPLASSGGIGADKTMPFDSWRALLREATLPIEWHVGVRRDGALPIAWGAGVARDHELPIEFDGGIKLAADYKLPYEVLQSAGGLGWKLPIAWSGDVGISRTLPIEWVLGLHRDIALPFEILHGVGPYHKLPWESRGVIPLDADYALPFASAGTLKREFLTQEEWDGWDPFSFWLLWDVRSLMTLTRTSRLVLTWDVLNDGLTNQDALPSVYHRGKWRRWIRTIEGRRDIEEQSWVPRRGRARIIFRWAVKPLLKGLVLTWQVVPPDLVQNANIQNPAASGWKAP
jgi:hypothetical protein